MPNRYLWACVLLLLASRVGAEEPAYTIKIKAFPDEGKSVQCRETETQKSLLRFLSSEGKVLREDRPTEETLEEFTLTVLESGDKVPRRYRQAFSKATCSTLENKNRSYQGLSVQYNLRGGKYRLELPENGDIPASDQDLLLGRANSEIEAGLDEVFIANRPVKVGESWKVEPKVLNRGFGQHGKLDPEKTEGTAQLVKVYDRDGKRFGVIEVDLTVGYVAMDKMLFDPPALFHVKGTLDADIDGTSNVGVLTLTTRLKGRGQLDQGNVRLTLEIVRESTTRKERSPVKDK